MTGRPLEMAISSGGEVRFQPGSFVVVDEFRPVQSPIRVFFLPRLEEYQSALSELTDPEVYSGEEPGNEHFPGLFHCQEGVPLPFSHYFPEILNLRTAFLKGEPLDGVIFVVLVQGPDIHREPIEEIPSTFFVFESLKIRAFLDGR